MNPVRDTKTIKIMNNMNYQQVGIIKGSHVPLEIRPAEGMAAATWGGLFLTGLSLTG